MAEQSYRVLRHDRWMVRILDVARALEARGFPPDLECELSLDVRDDVLPHNAQRFVLEVCKGRGRVRKGGRGKLRIDVRGLAALYTGHWLPADLVAVGLLDGPERDCATASTLFAGPAPWMPDFF